MKTKKVMDLDGSGAYTQGLGSLFGLVFVEKLSPFFLEDKFCFLVDEWLTCYLFTELFAAILLFVIVLLYHDLVILLCCVI